MKVIFLDFDGVLNSSVFITEARKWRQKNQEKHRSVEWWASDIDPKAVALLNFILSKTEAQIVISSSWRYGCSLDLLRSILKASGCEGEVIAVTPRMPGNHRSDKIQEWLRLHPEVDSFVVLDDARDAGIDGKFVQTDYGIGLTQEDAEKAVEILNDSKG